MSWKAVSITHLIPVNVTVHNDATGEKAMVTVLCDARLSEFKIINDGHSVFCQEAAVAAAREHIEKSRTTLRSAQLSSDPINEDVWAKINAMKELAKTARANAKTKQENQ